MNPDAHWNTAMYRSLDYLQLKNGTEQVVLNRDDAAGFRLDTTFTHKQPGFANFIDEWSQCDFYFTNLGVILE